MTHPLNPAIEMALQQADRNDEFKDLPGAGKPLKHLHQSKDAVLSHLMKEHQAKPQAVVLKQQISEETAKLKTLTDAAERKAQMKVLSDLQLKLALEVEALTKYG